MIKKFANLDPFSRFILKGTIKTGCKAAKISCPSCQRLVVGLKLTDRFYCSQCGIQITPKPAEGEFTQSLPYFLVPDDIKELVGAKPTSLTVVPAYTSLDRTIPNSYTRYTKDGRILCTGGGRRSMGDVHGKRTLRLCGPSNAGKPAEYLAWINDELEIQQDQLEGYPEETDRKGYIELLTRVVSELRMLGVEEDQSCVEGIAV